jgi:hypothetical protein
MLKYGGVPVEESEVIFRLDKLCRMVHVCSTWAEYSRKLEKRYGAPPKYQEREGFVTVANWVLPVRVVGLRSLIKRPGPPRKTQSLTSGPVE